MNPSFSGLLITSNQSLDMGSLSTNFIFQKDDKFS